MLKMRRGKIEIGLNSLDKHQGNRHIENERNEQITTATKTIKNIVLNTHM